MGDFLLLLLFFLFFYFFCKTPSSQLFNVIFFPSSLTPFLSPLRASWSPRFNRRWSRLSFHLKVLVFNPPPQKKKPSISSFRVPVPLPGYCLPPTLSFLNCSHYLMKQWVHSIIFIFFYFIYSKWNSTPPHQIFFLSFFWFCHVI